MWLTHMWLSTRLPVSFLVVIISKLLGDLSINFWKLTAGSEAFREKKQTNKQNKTNNRTNKYNNNNNNNNKD